MKIAVLLSGGVDSAVAAMLLQEQGYDITGLTMINYHEEIAEEAKELAAVLGISHRVVDLREAFAEKVIDYFCQVYEKGCTPNPCVMCNRYLKFGLLLDIAMDMGFDMVATGHYARIEYNSLRNRYLLKKGIDSQKDQSYFLYVLQQEQLARTIFPLGNIGKDKVREIARDRGIQIGTERDSQEICFIEGDYRDFIKGRINFQPGKVVDLENNELGTHRGLPFYTIGQRRGLGISAGRPVYVVDMDLVRNLLIVDDEEKLYRDSLSSMDNNMIYVNELDSSLRVEAKIRYKANPAAGILFQEEDRLRIEFEQAQRAITPGQSVVYYIDDYVLGGGVIE